MRKDIDIELVRDGRDQITAFNVAYSLAIHGLPNESPAN